MEYFYATSDKHGFEIGKRYPVLRTIMNECVVIIPEERTPNVILHEKELCRCGNLSGEPQLSG